MGNSASVPQPQVLHGEDQTIEIATEKHCATVDHRFIIEVFGDGGVGKSEIVHKALHGDFQDVYDPTIFDTHRCTVRARHRTCQLEIFDTSGQEGFRQQREMIHEEYKINARVLVYSILSTYSFEYAKEILDRQGCPEGVMIVLVGNMTDEEKHRQVETESGSRLARQLSIPFFEVSAKSGDGIANLTRCIVFSLLDDGKAPDVSKGSLWTHLFDGVSSCIPSLSHFLWSVRDMGDSFAWRLNVQRGVLRQ